MTNTELKRASELMRAFEPSRFADMWEYEVECSECPFGGEERKCPFGNELEESKAIGDFKNSCVQVIEDYIRTGEIIDHGSDGNLSGDV